MTDEITPNDFSLWLSSYGALTANRILERFNIHLVSDELMPAIKNPLSIYHQLLIIPLQNVFNGIVLQQAREYQLYAQKLFIDYLLSGENSKNEALPGANTREELEHLRIKLVEINEAFGQQEFAHFELISESQADLIKLSSQITTFLNKAAEKVNQILTAGHIVKDNPIIQRAIRTSITNQASINKDVLVRHSSFWTDMEKVLAHTLTDQLRDNLAEAMILFADPRQDMALILTPYKERIADMRISLRSYRQQFYDIILRATELINLLPEYKINLTQTEKNRALLYFDSSIGDR